MKKLLQKLLWYYCRFLHWKKWGNVINHDSISEWQATKRKVLGIILYPILTDGEIEYLVDFIERKK